MARPVAGSGGLALCGQAQMIPLRVVSPAAAGTTAIAMRWGGAAPGMCASAWSARACASASGGASGRVQVRQMTAAAGRIPITSSGSCAESQASTASASAGSNSRHALTVGRWPDVSARTPRTTPPVR